MDSNNVQYSGGQYAQGLVLAQLPELAGKISELLAQEKDTLLKMSKTSMDAAVNAAGKVLMSSLAQAGSSLAGAAAGGANGIAGGTALKSMISENSIFTAERSRINGLLEGSAEGNPTLQIKQGPKPLTPTNITNGQHEFEMKNMAAVDHSKMETPKPPNKEKLERDYDKCSQDHKQKQKEHSHGYDTQKSLNQALAQYAPEALLQPFKGTQDKDLEQERGKQNLSGQAATQAETAKEQTVSTLTTLIQQTDVQGYASGMTR